MSGYTLTWKPDVFPILAEGAALRPDTLGTLSPEALAATPIPLGRTLPRMDELFHITGSPGDTLTLRGLPPVLRLGARMTRGTLIVEGDAGDDLGASMSGGEIHVHGSVGQRAGGPDGASDRGMTGGVLLIHGSAGDYAGFRQRGGLIHISGACGQYPGYRMMAGTLSLGSGPYESPGRDARRGTILCHDAAQPYQPDDGYALLGDIDAHELAIVGLMSRDLHTRGVAFDATRLRLYTGDRHQLNKVELWQRLS